MEERSLAAKGKCKNKHLFDSRPSLTLDSDNVRRDPDVLRKDSDEEVEEFFSILKRSHELKQHLKKINSVGNNFNSSFEKEERITVTDNCNCKAPWKLEFQWEDFHHKGVMEFEDCITQILKKEEKKKKQPLPFNLNVDASLSDQETYTFP